MANGTPFCDSFLCCNAICAIRPQCCLFGWDQICADLAAADEQNCQQCQGCGTPAAGDCCSANGTTFCNDDTCCNAVCANSPQCCVLNWTQACADLAGADAINCPQCKSDWCGAPAAGDCCSANGTAFCDDATCCNAVCANSPQCCAISWTQFCADQAAGDAINCQGCQPTCPPDLDGDGDVDLADFAAFLDCDLDLAEYAAFVEAFTGPG